MSNTVYGQCRLAEQRTCSKQELVGSSLRERDGGAAGDYQATAAAQGVEQRTCARGHCRHF
jgi:hypothetical protein